MGSTGSGVVALLLTTVAVAVAQPETAFDWNQLGVAAADRGDLGEAEQDYQKALSLWRALGPSYQAHTAATLYNLGQTFVGQGRWRDSIPVLEEALDLSRHALSIRHVRALTILNTLGRVYMVTGEFDRAATAFLEALGIEREIMPDQIELA
jgi:tetratricopeptide (TPR) repeat protein